MIAEPLLPDAPEGGQCAQVSRSEAIPGQLRWTEEASGKYRLGITGGKSLRMNAAEVIFRHDPTQVRGGRSTSFGPVGGERQPPALALSRRFSAAGIGRASRSRAYLTETLLRSSWTTGAANVERTVNAETATFQKPIGSNVERIVSFIAMFAESCVRKS
jgi:hypothetical protein